MRRQLAAEMFHERRVHELVVVGNAEDDDRFVAEFGGETLQHAGGVLLFHAENPVGPADVAGGEFEARAIFGAGRSGFISRVIMKQRLGRGAAPLIARAEEEQFGFHGGLRNQR